jgi:inward rectifier potassium channel
MSVWKSGKQVRHLRVGDRHVITRGLYNNFWEDLYHRFMSLSWPAFFASAALVFITINTLFAGLYALGTDPIANLTHPSDLFFFSIETLATVGYGDMHPQTPYAHTIAAFEIFTGMSCIAVVTGLVFARFSRPTARVLFARHAVVGLYNGKTALMIRMANARQNAMTGARAKLWLSMIEKTKEGGQLRRFVRLPLLREESPLFTLSWTVFHMIDEASPLARMTHEDLIATEASLILTVDGLDESSTQQIQARGSYGPGDIRWQHRYANIVEKLEGGVSLIDYRRFHDVEAEPLPPKTASPPP